MPRKTTTEAEEVRAGRSRHELASTLRAIAEKLDRVARELRHPMMLAPDQRLESLHHELRFHAPLIFDMSIEVRDGKVESRMPEAGAGDLPSRPLLAAIERNGHANGRADRPRARSVVRAGARVEVDAELAAGVKEAEAARANGHTHTEIRTCRQCGEAAEHWAEPDLCVWCRDKAAEPTPKEVASQLYPGEMVERTKANGPGTIVGPSEEEWRHRDVAEMGFPPEIEEAIARNAGPNLGNLADMTKKKRMADIAEVEPQLADRMLGHFIDCSTAARAGAELPRWQDPALAVEETPAGDGPRTAEDIGREPPVKSKRKRSAPQPKVYDVFLRKGLEAPRHLGKVAAPTIDEARAKATEEHEFDAKVNGAELELKEEAKGKEPGEYPQAPNQEATRHEPARVCNTCNLPRSKDVNPCPLCGGTEFRIRPWGQSLLFVAMGKGNRSKRLDNPAYGILAPSVKAARAYVAKEHPPDVEMTVMDASPGYFKAMKGRKDRLTIYDAGGA